jgi:two-component system nitrate/nitrite response regulator NarL
MKALLIDDHALFRAGLSGLLERRGIEVVASVGSGEEGIGTLETLLPDIILLDLRMP